MAAIAKAKNLKYDDTKITSVIDEEEFSSTKDENPIYQSDIAGVDLDFNISLDKIFAGFSYKNGQIMIDGHPYDIDITISKGVPKYTIELEYNNAGISGAIVVLREVYLLGEVIVDSDENTYKKDFEITYNEHGIVENSLSGTMNLGDKTLTIPPISKKVELDTMFGGSSNNYFSGIFGKSLNINIFDDNSPGKIILEY